MRQARPQTVSLYDKERIQQKKEQEKPLNKNLKNIAYDFKKDGSLPLISEQILFCHNQSDVWFELTNYEFLINGKESNKLVTTYIGKTTTEAAKIPLEIFDPEAAFVFQDAVLKYWDKTQPANSPSLLDLAKAIQAGYTALNYHFGFTNSLDNQEITQEINSPEELAAFLENLHAAYQAQAIKINRYVTTQDLTAKANLGFIAYYPNPIYLQDIVWYSRSRPKNINYNEFKLSKPYSMNCFQDNPETLLDKNTPKEEYNEYYDILKSIYPEIENQSYPKENLSNPPKYSDFKPLTYKSFKLLDPAYLFRGDSQNLETIAQNNGFNT